MTNVPQTAAERRPKKKMVTRMTAASPSRLAGNRSKSTLANQAARALMANRDGTQMKYDRDQTRPHEETTEARPRGPSRFYNPNKQAPADDSFTYDDSTRHDDDSLSSEYSNSTHDSSSDCVTQSDSFSVDRPSTSESRSFDKDERQDTMSAMVDEANANTGTKVMAELSRDMPSVVWEDKDEDESTYVKSPTSEVVQNLSNKDVAPPLSKGVAKEWGLGDKARPIPYNKLEEDEQPLLAISSSTSSAISALAQERVQSEDDLDIFHESKEHHEPESGQQREKGHVEGTAALDANSADGECNKVVDTRSTYDASHSSVHAMMPFDEVAANEAQSMWQPPMFPEVAMPISRSPTSETEKSSKYFEARESENHTETIQSEFNGDSQDSNGMQLSQLQISNPPSPQRTKLPALSPSRTSSIPSQDAPNGSPRKRSVSASPSKRTKQSHLQKTQDGTGESFPNMFEDQSSSIANPSISPIRKKNQTSPKHSPCGDATKENKERTSVIHQKNTSQNRENLTPGKTPWTTPNRQEGNDTLSEMSSKVMAEKDAEQERPPIVQNDKDADTSAPVSMSPTKGQQDPMEIQGSNSDDEMHFSKKSYPEDILKRMKTPPEQLQGLINVTTTEKSGARRMNACGAFKKLAGVNMRNALSLAWTEGILIALATVLVDPQASNQELIRTLTTLLFMVKVPLNRRIVFLTPNMIDGLSRCLKDESSEVFTRAGECIELLAKEKRIKPLMPGKKALMQELCARLDEYVILDKTKDQTVETLTELGLNDTAASFDGERTQSVENVALSAMEALLSLSAVVHVSLDLARIDFVMKALINMSDKVSAKFSSLCNGIFANLTQHPENREYLAFQVPNFISTIVTSAACSVDERRKYACYALQNLSSSRACRELLGSTRNLLPTLSENCLRSEDISERIAALTAMGNLSKHQNNLIHFTSNNCVGTLLALARSKHQPKLQYLASDTLVTLSYWMRESTIFALH